MAQCFCTKEKCLELEQRIEALEAFLSEHINKGIPDAHSYSPEVRIDLSSVSSKQGASITANIKVDNNSASDTTIISFPSIENVDVNISVDDRGNITNTVTVDGVSGSDSSRIIFPEPDVLVDISGAYNSTTCELKLFTDVRVGNKSDNDTATLEVACKNQSILPPLNNTNDNNNNNNNNEPNINPPTIDIPPLELPPLPEINFPDTTPSFPNNTINNPSLNTDINVQYNSVGSIDLDIRPLSNCDVQFTVALTLNGVVSVARSTLNIGELLQPTLELDYTLNNDNTATLTTLFQLCNNIIIQEVIMTSLNNGECDLTPVIQLINNLTVNMGDKFSEVNNQLNIIYNHDTTLNNSLTNLIQSNFNLITNVITQLGVDLQADLQVILNTLNVDVLVKLDLIVDKLIELNLEINLIKNIVNVDGATTYQGNCKELVLGNDNVYGYERNSENKGILNIGTAIIELSTQIENLHKDLCNSINIDRKINVSGQLQKWICEPIEQKTIKDIGYILNPVPDSSLVYTSLDSAISTLYNTIIDIWKEVCSMKTKEVTLPEFLPIFKCIENEGVKTITQLSLEELNTLDFYKEYVKYLYEVPNPNDIDPNTGKPKINKLTFPASYANYVYNSIFLNSLLTTTGNTLEGICKLDTNNDCQVLVDDKSVYSSYGLYLALYWSWEDKIKTGIHQTPLRNPIDEIVNADDAEYIWNKYFNSIYRIIGNQWALLWTEDNNGNCYKLPWCQGWFLDKNEAKRYFNSIIGLTKELARVNNNPSYSDKDNKTTNIVNAGKKQYLRKVCLIQKTPNSNETIVIKSFSKPTTSK